VSGSRVRPKSSGRLLVTAEVDRDEAEAEVCNKQTKKSERVETDEQKRNQTREEERGREGVRESTRENHHTN
jgi:hypothetical protein